MNTGFDIQYLKNIYQPNKKLRYCPKIAAAEKTGRGGKADKIQEPIGEECKEEEEEGYGGYGGQGGGI